MSETILNSLNNTSGGSISIPEGGYIKEIIQMEKIGNRVVGGIKYGSSPGADDVVASFPLNPNDKQRLCISGYLTPEILYFEAVDNWNTAVVDIYIIIGTL